MKVILESKEMSRHNDPKCTREISSVKHIQVIHEGRTLAIEHDNEKHSYANFDYWAVAELVDD